MARWPMVTSLIHDRSKNSDKAMINIGQLAYGDYRMQGKMVFLVHWLLVMMHASVLFLLDFVHPGGHDNSPKEVFGDTTTELLTMQQ